MQNAAAAFARDLQPYKRVLAVLVRPTCVSLAVSNPYQSLAEPAGAVLLRGGKVPERTLARLLERASLQEVTGVLWGCEHLLTQEATLQDPHAAATLRQVQDVLRRLVPTTTDAHTAGNGVTHAWWSHWRPDQAPSPKLLAHEGLGQAAHTAPPIDTDACSAPVLAAPTQPTSPVQGPPHTSVHATQATHAAVQELEITSRPPPTQAARADSGGGPAPCSKATLFLQHWLDSLGSQNTFG